jgi:5-methylcytosine-specific restriction endonuclease McrA
MFQILILLIFALVALLKFWSREESRKKRREYYRNEYLKSEAWQRKRYVVMRRDNWRCVYCGAPATQVHHKRYAKYNIGKEPIDWLVSICKTCHQKHHHLTSNR